MPIFIKNCGGKRRLQDCTWAEISQLSEAGGAKGYWHIGDKKTVTLSGEVNGSFEVQVADFDFYDKSDGSGKAGIVFAFTKNVIDASASYGQRFNLALGFSHAETDMLGDELAKIKSSLPSDLQSAIKKVTVRNACGTSGLLAGSGPHYGPRSGAVVSITDVELFPPSYAEVTNGGSFTRNYINSSYDNTRTETVREGEALGLYKYSASDDLTGTPLDKGGGTFLRTVYSTFYGYFPGYIYIKGYGINNGKISISDSTLSYTLSLDDSENINGTGAKLGLCPMFCI